MGMSHRGRLNVIVQVAKRPPEEIFAGFEDVDPRSVLGSGDVKYHMGATGEYVTRCGDEDSHSPGFESQPPGSGGSRDRGPHPRQARPRRTRWQRRNFCHCWSTAMQRSRVRASLAETLNLPDLKGYTVGGTVHIIANNLLGFTTLYSEEHSSRFSAQLARRQSIPIFHVNAEDVDAVVRVGRIGSRLSLHLWKGDVVIDLIGYRRHGHSEVDDPTVTQPLLYKAIKDHPPLWEIYAEDIGASDAQAHSRADQRRVRSGAEESAKPFARSRCCANCRTIGTTTRAAVTSRSTRWTPASLPRSLREITARLTTYPADFHIHPKVKKLLEQRAEMGTGKRARRLRHG